MQPRGPVVFLVLATWVLLAASFAPPAAAYGERVIAENQARSNEFYAVDADLRVAQSFVPAMSFLLRNVTLWVRNLQPQDDRIDLTVETDAGGEPSGTVVSSSIRGAGGTGWLDFPLGSFPKLEAGTKYWIVATSRQAAGGGYGWYHAGGDVVPGEARVDNGTGWRSPDPTDLAYVAYGLVLTPSLAVGLVPEAEAADAGATVRFDIHLNNSGFEAATNVNVDLALPPELVFIDSAVEETLNGSSLGGTRWHVHVLPNGPYAFEVVAVVRGNLTFDRIVTATLTVTYEDPDGRPRGPVTSQASLVLRRAATPGGILGGLPLLLGLLAAAAAVPTGYWLWRSRAPPVEEAFLVSRGGLLIYHVSRHMHAEGDRDRDLLSGMLTLIRGFVEGSVEGARKRDLRELRVGNLKMLIEGGRSAYLAVVFSGRDSPALSRRVEKTVVAIDQMYGEYLKDWDGRVGLVAGVRDVVDRLVRRR